jgi:hypothetical protein
MAVGGGVSVRVAAGTTRGLQEAVFRLGRVPESHQPDNSTAATLDLATCRRCFNAE